MDTSTGWKMFPEKEGNTAIYDNIQLKWSKNPTHVYAREQYNLYMSVDNGITWKSACYMHELFHLSFPGMSYHDEEQRTKALAPIYKARDVWKRARAKELKKKLDSATPEQKEARANKLAAAKEKKRIEDEALKSKRTVAAIDHMVKLGPELVKLREKIERVVDLMSKGGIDRPIVQHDSKLWKIKSASYLLDQFEKHFLACQARTKK